MSHTKTWNQKPHFLYKKTHFRKILKYCLGQMKKPEALEEPPPVSLLYMEVIQGTLMIVQQDIAVILQLHREKTLVNLVFHS